MVMRMMGACRFEFWLEELRLRVYFIKYIIELIEDSILSVGFDVLRFVHKNKKN